MNIVLDLLVWWLESKGVAKYFPHVALYNHHIIHILVVYVVIYVEYSLKGTQLFHLMEKAPKNIFLPNGGLFNW